VEPAFQSLIRVGVIGLDSSHTLQFSRRIRDMHARGQTRCRVTGCWDTEANSQTCADAAAALLELGIRSTGSLDELLASVDAAMILTQNGHRHFDLAMNSLNRGLPTFIDKPLSCSAGDAAALVQFTRTRAVPCYSASALRFIDELPDFPIGSLGRLESIEVSGPFQEVAQMPGLWFYACHTFELLDSLWDRAGNLRRIRSRVDDTGHRINLEYHDGRSAVIGLDREGVAPFAALLRGEKGSFKFQAGSLTSYDRLVESICRFFESGKPDIPLENTANTIAAIECAERSLSHGGEWITLEGHVASPTHNPGVLVRKK